MIFNPFSKKLAIPYSGEVKLHGSYAQVLQDIFIILALNGKKNGKYVEIGAGCAAAGSNTYLLRRRLNWSGISFEYNEELKKDWEEYRPNDKIYFEDATQSNYLKYFNENFVNNHLDYLQLDIDPPHNTLKSMYAIPFDKYKFSVITYETDVYTGYLKGRDESREYFKSLGYELLVSDVEIGGCPFEDWWINREFVNEEVCELIHKKSQIKKIPSIFLFQ